MSKNVGTVWLDPGHDSAKANPSPVNSRYFEGTQMWLLAGFLREELEALGVPVKVTKERVDQKVGLTERGGMSKGGALFLSLHSNAASAQGPDWVLALHQVEDGDPELTRKSKSAAEALGAAAAEVMGLSWKSYAVKSDSDRNKNGLPDDYYGVLRGARFVGTPGVILEHGFHTNPANAAWLLQEKNLRALARAEAKTLAEWLEVREPAPKKEAKKVQKASVSLPLLRKGQEGEAVASLQRLLIGKGWSCGPGKDDGIFGGATEAAVKRCQEAIGADRDGIVGPITWAGLIGV